MKVDKMKLYNALITLCWCVIIFCLILKIFGYKEFEIPILGGTPHHIVRKIINCILYCINGTCFIIILIKRLLKTKELLIVIPINIFLYILSVFPSINIIQFILEFISYPIIGILLTKDKWYRQLLESTIISITIIIYQAITMLYKNIPIAIKPVDFISDKVLQIDYYVIVLLTILKNIKIGGYIYGRWQKFLVLLSKPKRFKECLFKNKKSIQEVDEEIGFKLFIIFLSIAQLVGVGVCCYFINNVIVEYVIIVMSFFILRKVFGKCYHANSVIKCTTLSILVFVIATRISLPLWLSVFCNVLIGCLVAYTMYVMYYFIKFTTTSGITIHKGMSLEDLNSLCELHKVDEIDKTILVEYYVKRKHIDAIAYKLNYSTDAIKKRKANILKRIREV